MNKQIFVIIDFENLNTNFITSEFTYRKLKKYYKNLFFINCNFKKKKEIIISKQIKRKLKEFKIFFPESENQFLDYFKNKKTVIINAIPKHFSYLKIFFLLNKIKNNSKQIILSNIGQVQGSWSNLDNKLNTNYLKIYLNNKICPKVISFLSNLDLIPKIDIRFYSNKNYLRSIKNSFLKNFLYKHGFFYTKKIIPVNSKFFDEYRKTKIRKIEKLITHIDLDLDYRHKIDKNKNYNLQSINNHYKALNLFLLKLKKIFKKKVVVSIHPKYDLNKIQKKFPGFKVVKYRTKELIQNSFLVTDFGSSALLDAIFLNKNIISLNSPFMRYKNNVYSNFLNLSEHSIINSNQLNKKKLTKEFRINKKKYLNLLNDRHIVNKNNYGYKVIISETNKLFKSI